MVLFFALAGCKPALVPSDSDSPTVAAGSLLGIGVAPRDPITQVGETVEFFATAYYENTSYENVTAEVVWSVSDARVAMIDRMGVVTALGEGTTEVLAVDEGGKGNSVLLTVLDGGSTLDGVMVMPAQVSLNVGDNVQLSAQARYSDGTTGTLGAACRWESSDEALASIDPAGRITGIAAGSVTASASCSGFSSQASVMIVEETVDLGQADLTAVGPSTFASGLDVFWEIEIRNQGTAASPGFYVDAYLATPVPEDYVDTQWVSGLAPDESITVSLETLGTSPASYSTYLVIDPENFVDESNEGNNQVGPFPVQTSQPLVGPDIIVRHFFAFTDGIETEYLFQIENQGDMPAEDFYLDVFLDRAGAPTGCSEFGDAYFLVESLAPGANLIWDPLFMSAPATGASWTSWGAVDLCEDLNETNTSDNTTSYLVEE